MDGGGGAGQYWHQPGLGITLITGPIHGPRVYRILSASAACTRQDAKPFEAPAAEQEPQALNVGCLQAFLRIHNVGGPVPLSPGAAILNMQCYCMLLQYTCSIWPTHE